MTDFRRQLQQARDAHRATRYPGDLAADVLGGAAIPIRSASRRPWWIAGAVGIAAAIAIAAVLYQPAATTPETANQQALGLPRLPTSRPTAIAQATSADETLPSLVPSLDDSSTVSLAPSSGEMLPSSGGLSISSDTGLSGLSMPLMPSYQDVYRSTLQQEQQQQQNQTSTSSKESA